MTSKIEGISAETYNKVAEEIYRASLAYRGTIAASEAITALLASGEVVLRKDVGELVAALKEAKSELRDHHFDHPAMKQIDEALAKFTTKPTIGE